MGVTAQTVVNVSAMTGQLLVAFQAITCISVAVAFLVTGGMVVGDTERDRVSAVAMSDEDILNMYRGGTYTANLLHLSTPYHAGDTESI